MTLFYGVLCLSLAGILFAVTLIGARNPKAPKWAVDTLVSNVYIPLLVGLILLGVCLLINLLMNLGKSMPTMTEAAISAAIAAGTLFGIKRLRIKQRLAAFESMPPAAQAKAPVIPMPGGSAPEPGAPKPSREQRSAA
ncbi:MAG: hypothetical protein PVG78_16390 [Desulfobacterales bacterium]|jgi:hypothetical protein